MHILAFLYVYDRVNIIAKKSDICLQLVLVGSSGCIVILRRSSKLEIRLIALIDPVAIRIVMPTNKLPAIRIVRAIYMLLPLSYPCRVH